MVELQISLRLFNMHVENVLILMQNIIIPNMYIPTYYVVIITLSTSNYIEYCYLDSLVWFNITRV